MGTTTTANELPQGKQTKLALYVTAMEAYERWRAEPERVKVIDVRTPEEYIFLGHATMAWLVPVAVQKYAWDAEKGRFPMAPLPDFVSRMQGIAKATDVLLLMCRSGGRSAIAVNMLAQAGFTQVYQIVDGFEGDLVDDPDSAFKGQRMRNGWRNAGCPWTYTVDVPRMIMPTLVK